MGENSISPGPAGPGTAPSARYAYYAFFVLFLVNVSNNLDRYILGILAPDIKKSLNLSDADLGFLLGTAFAVFYTVVGIAIGRIADRTSRTRLLALGIVVWSFMTVFGGLAKNFTMLAAARIGVGVGEATGNPCSQSLLADYFPPRRRSLATSCFLIGNFMGSMLAMVIGGLFVQHWSSVCTNVPIAGACAVPGWKAALICIGLPGLPLAILVATLREPRPAHENEVGLGRLIVRELSASLPPFSAFSLGQLGGRGAVQRNLLLVLVLVIAASLLAMATGDTAQWSAAALGTYAIATWATIIKLRDRPFYELTFGSPVFMLLAIGAGLVACAGGAATVWAASYVIRTLGMPAGEAGISLGVTYTAAAVVGLVGGGWVTDRWKQRDPRAPLWMGMISVVGGAPGLLVMVLAQDSRTFIIGYALFGIIASMSSGATISMVHDLVLPRMRASAISIFSLTSTLLAAGIGPYWVGKISTLTGSLSMGLFSMELLTPIAVGVLFLAARRFGAETSADRSARATAAGEPGDVATVQSR